MIVKFIYVGFLNEQQECLKQNIIVDKEKSVYETYRFLFECQQTRHWLWIKKKRFVRLWSRLLNT